MCACVHAHALYVGMRTFIVIHICLSSYFDILLLRFTTLIDESLRFQGGLFSAILQLSFYKESCFTKPNKFV